MVKKLLFFLLLIFLCSCTQSEELKAYCVALDNFGDCAAKRNNCEIEIEVLHQIGKKLDESEEVSLVDQVKVSKSISEMRGCLKEKDKQEEQEARQCVVTAMEKSRQNLKCE